MSLRIIPTIIVDSGAAYHTINFKKNLYLGDPINICRIYNEKNCDEIVIMDVSKNNDFSLVNLGKLERLTENVFVPISYGGGLTSIEDIDKVFTSGIDKVILKYNNRNSCELSKIISEKYGLQSVVISLNLSDKFTLRKGGLTSIKSIDEVINNLSRYYFGELLIQFVDYAGSKRGINLDLAMKIRTLLEKPMIYSGGVSNVQEMKELHNLGFDAVSVSSMFSLHPISGTPLISYISNEDRERFSI